MCIQRYVFEIRWIREESLISFFKRISYVSTGLFSVRVWSTHLRE
jgi:hypothetical protein